MTDTVPYGDDALDPSEVDSAGAAEGLSLRTRVGAASDTGLVRALNEDSYLAQSPVFLVADGMGGHLSGDRASQCAIAAFQELAGAPYLSDEALSRALARAAVEVDALGAGMSPAPGCTLTGVVLSTALGEPCLRVVNVGDSRTYLHESGILTQVTRDHSELQALIDSGHMSAQDAAETGRSNVITRALGAGLGPSVAADRYVLAPRAGQRFLVCSDGVCGYVPDSVLESTLAQEQDPQRAAEALIALALQAGGWDNATAIVLDILSAPEAGDDDGDTIPVGSPPPGDTA